MNYTWTQTYTVLEISKESYQDIKQRLAEVNRLNDYLTLDEKKEVILFGEVALKPEK